MRSGKHSDEENVIDEYSLPESSWHGCLYPTSNLNVYNQLRIAVNRTIRLCGGPMTWFSNQDGCRLRSFLSRLAP